MEGDKYHFLDIGGGAEWDNVNYDAQELVTDMNSLRGVKLAKENPDREYVIFDLYIPASVAAQKTHEISNLHFIVGRITTRLGLPFADTSMDKIEMNHMYTPLSIPADFQRGDDPRLYLRALSEACRVLKPGGTLLLTEKKERIDKILKLLKKEDHFDRMLMDRLGLNRDSTLIEVTDQNRTIFTSAAFSQRKFLDKYEHSDEEADGLVVFSLELTKISK